MSIPRPATDTRSNVLRAVSGEQLCTEDSVRSLRELLDISVGSKVHAKISSTSQTAQARNRAAKNNANARINKPTETARIREDKRQILSRVEQAKLATSVVNAGLNALVRAVREGGLDWSISRRQGRERNPSLSTVQSPGPKHNKPSRTLEERSANQQSPSSKSNVKSAQEPAQARACRFNDLESIGECCHAAFTHLRRITPSGKDLQLENGMLALVGKLLALKLVNLAGKELHALGARLRGPEVKASKLDVQNDYARLLTIADPASDVNRLTISIAYQLAIMRLVGVKQDPTAMLSVLDSLRSESATSPVPLILRLLHVTSDTARAGFQLQTLANTILSYCADISKDNDAATKNSNAFASPGECFELQTYALRARLSMMRTTGCTASTQDVVVKPFARCLAAYIRRSPDSTAGTYSLANELTQAFMSELRVRHEKSQTSSVDFPGLLGVCESLSSLAHAAGLPNDALRWLEADRGSRNQAVSQYTVHTPAATARLIKRAAIALDALLLDGSVEETTCCLEEAAASLQQDLSRVVVDDMFASSAIDFYKAVSSYSRTITAPAHTNAVPTSKILRQSCESIASPCLALCLGALQARLHSRPITQDLKFEAGLRNLYRAANCGIDHAVYNALRTRPGELDSVSLLSMLEDLECCTKLALLIVNRYRLENKDSDSASSSSLVNVSNAWLALYLAARDSSQDDALHSLKQSCHILEMGSKADKSGGHLPAKLSKLGRVLRSLDHWHDAAEYFTKLLHVSLDMGALERALAQCEPQGVDVDIWKMSECRSVAEALESILELEASHGIQKLGERGYFDSESLSTNQRRALINRQLSILSTWTSSRTLWTRAIKVMPKMSMELLEMYDDATEALARGQVLLRLLSLALEKQGDFNREFLERLDCSTASTIASLHNWKIQQPQHRATYIRSLLQACHVLRDHTSRFGLVAEIIATWHGLMDDVTSGNAILESFADVEEWSRLAQHVADYLYMLGSGMNRLSTLRFMMRLDAKEFPKTVNQTSSSNLDLSVELLRMGYSEAAGIQLESIRKGSHTLINTRWRSQFLLVYAEYYLILGNTDQSYAQLRKFRELRCPTAGEAPVLLSTTDKIRQICEISDYHHISSLLARTHHCHEQAEHHVRLQCSVLRAIWQAMEKQQNARRSNLKRSESDLATERLSSAIHELEIPLTRAGNRTIEHSSSVMISMAMQHILPRLTRAYDHAADLSTSSGQYQDTAYSIEQSKRLIDNLSLPYLQAHILAREGDRLVRGGELEAGYNDLFKAFEMCQISEQDHRLIAHHQAYGHYYHLCEQWQPELQAYHKAGILLGSLEKHGFLQTHVTTLPPMGDESSHTEKKAYAASQTQKTSRKPRHRTSARVKTKTAKMSRESQLSAKEPQSSTSIALLENLRADLIILEAQSLLAQQDDNGCQTLLQNIPEGVLPVTTMDRLAVTWTRTSFMEALNAMSSDAVFSMLPESSMSMPAALRPAHDVVTATFAEMRLDSPKKKGARVPKGENPGVSASSTEVVRFLYHALKCMVARQESISTSLPLAELVVACSTFASASMMLSYINADLASSLVDPARVDFWLALPSNTAARRDRSSVLGERLAKLDSGKLIPTSMTKSPRLSFKEYVKDHTEFIDLIPENWIIIAMSLDHDSEHIFLTQYRSGQQPLVVRLPLTRQNDDPDDEDAFTFADAKEELINIIAGSDATVHSARDNPDQLKVRGARSQWWASREALDERLRDLLINIENMWFGGFRCLFPRHKPAEDLLARFRQSFEIILEKHLPSRQQSRQRAGINKVKLDRHVLELFIGLGPPSQDNDSDESLTDLLYYVVDILQFNGELNAYDEIDFDAIIVEVQSAMDFYHDAFKTSEQAESVSHTILVLDKRLHAIPWESMPCLRERSVSRVHSVIDLQERLAGSGHVIANKGKTLRQQVSAHKGTYILNPGRDLAQTQSRFERPLSTLASGPLEWSGIVAKEPSEQEFLSALCEPSQEPEQDQKNRILLYIGHGSGEQYVRLRKIKQLRHEHWTPTPPSSSDIIDSTIVSKTETPTLNPSVSVALLFGCSSASLKLHSEFEPHGTPKSYMTAGAPALLGSLWDVTDGDVDRFAGGVLERWGLLERGICGVQEAKLASKGKRKGKIGKTTTAGYENDEVDFGCMSLTEAVARSRGECYLKYLNGAAMVVYGVPVFLDKTG